MEEAGVWTTLEAKPDGMVLEQYVEMLNDYALFAYQYDDGRNDLAIEILDKVIELAPDRAVAYLNMAEALEHLAKFGGTEYATMPLDDATMAAVRAAAASYRDKHRMLISGTVKQVTGAGVGATVHQLID